MTSGEGPEASSAGSSRRRVGPLGRPGFTLMAVRVASAWPAGRSSLGQGDFLSLHCEEFWGLRSTDLLLADPSGGRPGRLLERGSGIRRPRRPSPWEDTARRGKLLSLENISPSICTWPFQLRASGQRKRGRALAQGKVGIPLGWLLRQQGDPCQTAPGRCVPRQQSGPGPPGAAASGSGPASERRGPSQSDPASFMAQLCSPVRWGFLGAEGRRACGFSAALAVGALTPTLFKCQLSVHQNKTGSFEVITSR